MAEKQEKAIPILSRLRAPRGAVRPKKRLGRGVGSGKGKTSGKGMKGQKARHPGGFSKAAFQGGQMPLQRRLPKIGFWNPFRTQVATVNVRDLERFSQGDTIDVEVLRTAGLVKGRFDVVKVLGTGELAKSLTVKAHAFSVSAKAKIEKAGGKAELLAGGD